TSLVIVAFDVFAQATDTGTLAPMLDQAQWVIGRPLDAVSADAGYANLLDLQDCIARGVTLYAPVQANAFTEAKRQQRAATQPPRLDRDQFTWDDEAQTYICPQGHALRHDSKERKHRRDDEWVTEHRFRCPPTHCGACPLRDRCVTNPAKGRTIKRLEGQELLDELRARMATPPG